MVRSKALGEENRNLANRERLSYLVVYQQQFNIQLFVKKKWYTERVKYV